MIRAYEKKDLDADMAIWLSANLQAHSFIASCCESRTAES